MNIYIDAGWYVGNALRMHMDAGTVDDTWKIYAFDPSTDIEFDKEKWPKVNFIKKAAWIHDGYVEFQLSKRENASFIVGTSYSGAEYQKITVPCVDFSKFVANVAPYDKTVYIIISMDIEGSEYQVLQKMLDDHSIDNVSELDIEFHHRFMKDYDQNDSKRLVREIKKRGVRIRLKEAFQ